MSESATTVATGAASGDGSIVSRNPNASIALGSGAGLGPLVVWCVGFTGAPITPEVGAALGGIVAALFLLIGRRGIRGFVVSIWRGDDTRHGD